MIMLRYPVSYLCRKFAVNNGIFNIEQLLLFRIEGLRLASVVAVAAETPTLLPITRRFSTTTAGSENNSFNKRCLSSNIVARQTRCGCQLTARHADHNSHYNCHFPLLSQTRLYSRRQRFRGSEDDISETDWSVSSKVAIHDNNGHVISLSDEKIGDYVRKNHPDKKLQMTMKVTKLGERIARLVPNVKETSFMISTSIEPADLQVKIAAIQRKVSKGKDVIIKFSQRRGKSEKTVKEFATELQVKLEHEGLRVTLSNPSSESNVTLLVKSAPTDS